MAASQSRKTTSAKAAAVQYPRPKLACSRGSLVQCDQHPRVDFSTKEPHRRDKSRSTLSLLFTFLAHNYHIIHNLLCAPNHLLRYRASACRSFVCRLSAATLHYTATPELRYHVHFSQHLNLHTPASFDLPDRAHIWQLAADSGTDHLHSADTNAQHAKEGSRLDTCTGPTAREAREGQ
jgi:hypothetical protein